MSDLKIVVAGAGGRMGAANIRAVAATPGMTLHAALVRASSTVLGKDACLQAGLDPLDVPFSADTETALIGADAIIDFSAPLVSVDLAQKAAERGLIHVIGTTGCSAAEDWAIAQAGHNGARIIKAGNFSLGVSLLAGLVKKAAAALADYDIEIVEMHHNGKVDAPSGTALMLGQAAADGRGLDLAEQSVRGRDGQTGPRRAGTIGFAALRGGTVVGDHSVILAGPSERIELTHRAQDRSLFANGAVRAVQWAQNQPPGFYDMADVLGLNE
jgi:4-hydroxy-tetrahydrodipicolinate reductase